MNTVAKADETQQSSRIVDLVHTPLEAVAAYWLSLKKALDRHKNGRFLEEEARHAAEPFIRHLLSLLQSGFSTEDCRRLATVKQRNLLRDLHRKLDLLAICLLGIAGNENPQKVLIRIISKFSISPIFEKEVFEIAQQALQNLDKPKTREKFLLIDQAMKIEALIINMMVYSMYARRNDHKKMQLFSEYIRSYYFSEGMALIQDGFEHDFVKYRLILLRKEILADMENKMEMSLEMFFGMRNGVSYGDMFKIYNSFTI
ncbi:hypothetical protein [Desulfonatronum parangueonense]